MEKLKLNELSLCAGILVSLLTICAAVDTIAANQTIKDGETIVSAGDNFELGFFSPDNSNDRYLGIRYKRLSTGTVVWVANKGKPINDTSGVFKLSSDGSLLVLSDEGDTVVWASYSTNPSSVYLVAQLLDTGNLVVRDAINQENTIWQSNPPYDACVQYGICGAFGTCSNSYPACGCLAGFEPSRPKEWEIADWSGGCKRNKAIRLL
ncbi:putative non-specific serine/threonine protein kinase [Helianthus annuus]|nr:putative non-specific serine/threonine protein kinase [Helianthus annuus]